jgi:hypothetical protein
MRRQLGIGMAFSVEVAVTWPDDMGGACSG